MANGAVQALADHERHSAARNNTQASGPVRQETRRRAGWAKTVLALVGKYGAVTAIPRAADVTADIAAGPAEDRRQSGRSLNGQVCCCRRSRYRRPSSEGQPCHFAKAFDYRLRRSRGSDQCDVVLNDPTGNAGLNPRGDFWRLYWPRRY
jgi:hypothetical protein